MQEFTFNLSPEGADNQLRLLNDPGKESRDTFAQSGRKSKLQYKIRVVKVQHGWMTYQKKRHPSSLIVFEFCFQSKLETRRYKESTVTLEFFDKTTASLGGSDWDPIIVKTAPKGMRYLNRVTRDRTTTKGTTVGLQGGAGGNGVDAGVHWEVQDSQQLQYSARLMAVTRRSESKKSGGENMVEWSMEENRGRKPKEGVPPFLQAAVLLRRSGEDPSRPFLAKLKVSSAVDLVSKALRGLPWKTDEDKVIDTNLFDPADAQEGQSLVTNITPKELNDMHDLPVETYFKVDLLDTTLLATMPDPANESMAATVVGGPLPNKKDAAPKERTKDSVDRDNEASGSVGTAGFMVDVRTVGLVFLAFLLLLSLFRL